MNILTITTHLNKTSKILLGIIIIGLTLSAVNLIFQIIAKLNYKGYVFERILYWITLISIFVYALRKPLRKYRTTFLICFLLFLLIQCSQMLSTGKISTNKELKVNQRYTIKSGTSLITVPINSIYENKGFLEKEVSQWCVHLGKGNQVFTSLNEIDSLILLSENDSIFNIRFYKKNSYIDQIIKRKTMSKNGNK